MSPTRLGWTLAGGDTPRRGGRCPPSLAGGGSPALHIKGAEWGPIDERRMRMRRGGRHRGQVPIIVGRGRLQGWFGRQVRIHAHRLLVRGLIAGWTSFKSLDTNGKRSYAAVGSSSSEEENEKDLQS